jgi:uncharacterized protein (TIGR03083 family)
MPTVPTPPAVPSDAEIWTMVADERLALADLCDDLTPPEWDAASLCDDWRVRDVVAHLIFGIETGPASLFGKVLTSWLRVHHMLRERAQSLGETPTAELAARLRALVDARPAAPFPTAEMFLYDVVVHQQDIRRPLGRPRPVPEAHVRVALDSLKGSNRSTGSKTRIRGLRLVATDMKWSHGDGPEVTGTGEQLLMVMAGRMVVVGELGGPGKAALAGRA